MTKIKKFIRIRMEKGWPGSKSKKYFRFLTILICFSFSFCLIVTAQDNTMASPEDTMVAAMSNQQGPSNAEDTNVIQNQDNTISQTEPTANDHRHEYDLKRGQRLFYGLVRINGEDGINCASCHNTGYIDTLNWNPSAYEIAITSSNVDSLDFTESLLEPFGSARLEEAHAGIQLPPEDIELVRLYLDHVAETGLTEKKPTINKLLKFLGFLFLLVLVSVDLSTKKYLRYKAIHLVIILVASYFLIEMIALEAIALGRSEGYAPLQPVKFSHQVHAGQNQTDCLYCHHTAETSKSAGIPSVSLCMNCHLVIREGTRSGNFEINKIWQAMQDSTSIAWVRVHRLPDHVFFDHAQHVGAGKLDCAECHGVVEEMHVLKQHTDMSMGWCLDCHRTRAVQFVDNEYYDDYEKFHESIKNGQIDSVTVADVGGTECMKCHY